MVQVHPGNQGTLWEDGGPPPDRVGLVPPAGGGPLSGLSYAHKCTEQGNAPAQKGADPGQFILSVAINGACCRLTERTGDHPRATDKLRGEITGFSRASRLRLLEKANSIDRSKIAASWFLALTIPAADNSWDKIEPRRRAYVRKLRERWGCRAWFADWKKEPHPGNGPNHLLPHLHLMLHWLKGHPVPSLDEFRAWNDQAWADVVDATNKEQHKRVGCRVERIYSWNGVAFYTAKYFAKLVVGGEGVPVKTGRIWGRINEDVAPEDRQEQVLTPEVGKRARRILRKLQQRKRSYWLAWVDGRWHKLRTSRVLMSETPDGADPEDYSKAREVWLERSPDEQASILARSGGRVRLIRPKVVRTKEVQIWAQETETYKMLPMDTERHSFCSSLHFVKSSEVLRLVEFLERLYVLPNPPEDGIPF